MVHLFNFKGVFIPMLNVYLKPSFENVRMWEIYIKRPLTALIVSGFYEFPIFNGL